MGKPYKIEYCMICHRQLIVQNVYGWTGKELPHDKPYVCEDCRRKQEKERREKQEKERREKMSEYEKQCALMFANYTRDSKCKRGHAIPCSICKAVFNESCGV